MSPGFDVFGDIISGADVEAEVEAHLRYWLPTYIAVVEVGAFGPRDPSSDERENQNLAEIASWERAGEVRKWPESQLPAVVVVNQGLSDPFVDGEGKMWAKATTGVLHFAGADIQDNSRKAAQRYSAATRGLMAHHPGIGNGFAHDTTFLTESYDPLPVDDEQRTLAAVMAVFQLTVPHVVDTRAGTPEPADDPYAGVDDPQTPLTKSLEVNKR